MIINTNMASLNTIRQLSINQKNTQNSLAKLSSGLRINSAADDAAGLAISEKMRGQISGLNTASQNAQNGINLVSTAEGALNETTSILQRMRELAVQAGNDTNTSTDRAAMQTETNQLVQEIDRIGNTTQFNTKNLLNGGAGLATTTVSATVSGVAQNWIQITGGSANTKLGNLNVTAAAAATGATTGVLAVAAGAGAQSFTLNNVTLNYTATGVAGTDATNLAALINANSAQVGATATVTGGTNITLTNSSVGTASKLTLTAAAGAITAGAQAVSVTGTDATITDATIGANYTASGNTITVNGGNYNGMQIQLNGSVMSATAAQNLANINITGNGVLSLQIGANQSQTMAISISDMRSAALGVNAIDLSNSTNAGNAVTTIQTAIDTVSMQRANLGAYQNRLEHTINNLGTSSQNITSAEASIRDVDMAAEMTNFQKNNILQQAAQAMLAQANQQPQGVLQLLR